MRQGEPRQRRFGVGLVLAMVWGITAAAPSLAQHAAHATAPYTVQSVTDAQRTAARNQWGIDILGVRMTAAGHMLDFRYRVVDREKAGRLIHPKMGLVLVDQDRGEKLPVPRLANVGALQQTRSHLLPERTYSVLFANQSGMITVGSKVTIELGELTVPNLVVE